MNTFRAILKNGKIELIEPDFSKLNEEQEYNVLITFLEDDVTKSLGFEEYELKRTLKNSGKRIYHLSKRQKQVFSLARDGLIDKAIAERLSIVPGTVRNNLTKIYKILGVDNKTEAIKKAEEYGLLD